MGNNHKPCPLLDIDKVVHDAVPVGAARTGGVSEDGLGHGVRVDEIVIHAKVVAQLVRQDLDEDDKIKQKSFQFVYF
jgi:hypothetical protein